jgi:imidazolonepropionase-like amidohydrolase
MAFGTDAGVYPHSDNARQFKYIVECGMTPAQPIRSATSAAADLIGRADSGGSIEPNKFAGFIGVKGDPLKNVILEQLTFVMKGGVVVRKCQTAKPAVTQN